VIHSVLDYLLIWVVCLQMVAIFPKELLSVHHDRFRGRKQRLLLHAALIMLSGRVRFEEGILCFINTAIVRVVWSFDYEPVIINCSVIEVLSNWTLVVDGGDAFQDFWLPYSWIILVHKTGIFQNWGVVVFLNLPCFLWW
jgi:hypothetical protein